jgi:hypothetical protein
MAWRSSLWQLPADLLQLSSSISAAPFHLSVHSLLRAISENSTPVFAATLRTGRTAVVRSFLELNTESSHDVYKCFSRLQLLLEIEQAWNVTSAGVAPAAADISALGDGWGLRSRLLSNTAFDLKEIRLVLHGVIWKLLSQPASLTTQLYELSEVARKAGRSQIALNAISQLRRVSGSVAESSLAEARVLWKDGEHRRALKIVESLCASLSQSVLRANALRYRGKWLSLTMSVPPRQIIEECFEPALRLCPARSTEQAKCFYTLATCKRRGFFPVSLMPVVDEDRLYQGICDRIQSPEWAMLQVRLVMVSFFLT